jgi:hypothetical protein
MRTPVTLEQYEYRYLLHNSAAGDTRALFTVEHTSGQRRDEILSFPVIEARIRLWEDEASRMPDLVWRDRLGFLNQRQYVRALVEALKTYAL